MPTNDFVPFATGGGANVESQSTYLADTNRSNGNQAGIASSALNNKALRQGTFITSQIAQMISNLTGTDVLDNGVSAQFLAQLEAALQFLPPQLTSLLSGSGNYNLPYAFFIASGNATLGATYTNNSVTFTVLSTIAAGTLLYASGNAAPTVSGTLTKASGTGDATITFYAVKAPLALRSRGVGGGGGGGGANGTSGGNGGNTTFGTTLLVANGGAGGGNGSPGGAGGTASLGTGPLGIALSGSSGGSAQFANGNGQVGGVGGPSAFGGAGGTQLGAAGLAAATNSGSGGGGGSNNNASNTDSASGGGSGGFFDAIITNPLSTYAYAVGAAGTAGAGGAGGSGGGVGGSGCILIEARYQ